MIFQTNILILVSFINEFFILLSVYNLSRRKALRLKIILNMSQISISSVNITAYYLHPTEFNWKENPLQKINTYANPLSKLPAPPHQILVIAFLSLSLAEVSVYCFFFSLLKVDTISYAFFCLAHDCSFLH